MLQIGFVAWASDQKGKGKYIIPLALWATLVPMLPYISVRKVAEQHENRPNECIKRSE
jgi:hypothetical protein